MYFTKKGDKGFSEIDDKKIKKDHPLLKILGDLDELNSLIGFLKNFLKDRKTKYKLTIIQNDFFIIQANFAWLLYPKFKKPELKDKRIKEIETEIKKIEKIKPAPRNFIIPGSNLESGIFDYLRTRVRYLEREIIKYRKKVNKNILIYLNRLSSYFFALARLKSKKDIKPWY